MAKQTPDWVKKLREEPKQIRPVTENMQRKMNGSAPEMERAKAK